jgi:hypothetical protein
MTSPDPEIDALIDALRSDLPSDDHERRIRAQLVSAGVIAGAGLTLPAVAAGASASAKLGLLPKLAALSWGAKVGLASAVFAVAALPLASQLGNPETGSNVPPAAEGAIPTGTESEPREAHRSAPERSREQPAEPSPAAAPADAAPKYSPRTPPRQEPPLPAAPGPGEALSAGGPSVGSLPALEGSSAASREQRESTLREEADIMARALSALRTGDHATARRWLDEHARRFPNGQLQRERERARERAAR